MPNSVHSLSTSGLTPKKQIQCWTDALTELCGQFDVDPLEASSLEGRVNYTTVSRLKLCQIEVSQHRIAHPVSRAKTGEHPFVKILFQTYGISHFEQNGHRIELMPGDCLAYDVSCPHTIVSPSLTRHEVVIVPTELLQERGFQLAKLPACKISARTGTGRIAHDFMHAAFGEAPKLSPHTALGVADTLIDLLLLPLREAGTAFDRGGPVALYERAQAFIHDHLRDPDLSIDQISTALGCTKRYLHMLFSDTRHDGQRLYLAGKAVELSSGAGDQGLQDDHGCRIFVGLFELLTFQPCLQEVLRDRSVFHSQGAARRPASRRPCTTTSLGLWLRQRAVR